MVQLVDTPGGDKTTPDFVRGTRPQGRTASSVLEKSLCSGALVKVRNSCCPVEMGSGCQLPWAPEPLLPPFSLLGRAGDFLPWLSGGREAGGCRDQAFSPVSDGRDTTSVAPAPGSWVPSAAGRRVAGMPQCLHLPKPPHSVIPSISRIKALSDGRDPSWPSGVASAAELCFKSRQRRKVTVL